MIDLKRIQIGSMMFVKDKKMNVLKKIQLGLLLFVFFTLGFIFGKIDNVDFIQTNSHVSNSEITVSTEKPTLVAEPEVIKIQETVSISTPRYAFTNEDVYLLSLVLCGGKETDGDGEYDIDFEKNINHVEVDKVLSVIMNRVHSKIYPNSISKVVLQPGQFSVIPRNLNKTPSDKALQTVREWCEEYNKYSNSVHLIPDDHLYFTGNGVTNTTRAKWA